MTTRIDRLLELAGPPLGGTITATSFGVPGALGDQLRDLLARANGFFAFESALHLLPRGSVSGERLSLEFWNSEHLWRQSYGDLAAGLFFFAEDAFGGQFALADERIVTFDPETGGVEEIASSFEGWADAVLADYQLYTGFDLAHRWQQQHRPLRVGERLLPKKPFVLGGAFEVGNLYALDAVEGMRLRGELAAQLRDHPDGTSVTFKIVE